MGTLGCLQYTCPVHLLHIRLLNTVRHATSFRMLQVKEEFHHVGYSSRGLRHSLYFSFWGILDWVEVRNAWLESTPPGCRWAGKEATGQGWGRFHVTMLNLVPTTEL